MFLILWCCNEVKSLSPCQNLTKGSFVLLTDLSEVLSSTLCIPSKHIIITLLFERRMCVMHHFNLAVERWSSDSGTARLSCIVSPLEMPALVLSWAVFRLATTRGYELHRCLAAVLLFLSQKATAVNKSKHLSRESTYDVMVSMCACSKFLALCHSHVLFLPFEPLPRHLLWWPTSLLESTQDCGMKC